MSMTPEALRMLTNFMASAGAAIGGKGSAGDLIGQSVQAWNRGQEALALKEEGEIAKEKRAGQRGEEWEKKVKEISGQGMNMEASAQDVLEHYEPTNDWTTQARDIAGMFTPADQDGITSMSAGKQPGEFNVQVTSLSPEQRASAYAAGESMRRRPTAKDIQQKRQKAEAETSKAQSGAELEQVVQTPWGPMSAADYSAYTAQQAIDPTRIKTLIGLREDPELLDIEKELAQARSTKINVGQRVETQQALDAARRHSETLKPGFSEAYETAWEESKTNYLLKAEMNSPDPAVASAAVEQRRVSINDAIYAGLTTAWSDVGKVQKAEYPDGSFWFVVKENGKYKKLQKVQ